MTSPDPARPPEVTEELRRLDKAHFWHPFTPMARWTAESHRPLILTGGQGAWVFDSEGNRYLDGNASIWTNVHGHNHPTVNAAIREQLDRVAHVSALGTTNEPAIRLAAALAERSPGGTLPHVFFSDDGSTAVECACKLAIQYRQLRGEDTRCRFASIGPAYHGDTVGAGSLSGIALFHGRFRDFGFEVLRLEDFDALTSLPPEEIATLNAVVLEPLVQGAAGMRLWPKGMLAETRKWCDRHGVLLILDEVMTGFGRTGKLFACENEGVVPDFLALAKGLTGGYLPLGATLTSRAIFESFLGEDPERHTFFYGHSYCGNPLAAAAALASLRVFDEERTLEILPSRIEALALAIDEGLRPLSHVGEIRQCGLIAGIDVVRDSRSGDRFDPAERHGARICEAARDYGLLTRPVGDTLVLMPPLCVTGNEIEHAVDALRQAIERVCGS